VQGAALGLDRSARPSKSNGHAVIVPLSRLPSRDTRDGGAFPPETREGVTPTVTPAITLLIVVDYREAHQACDQPDRHRGEIFRFARRFGPISVSLSAAKLRGSNYDWQKPTFRDRHHSVCSAGAA